MSTELAAGEPVMALAPADHFLPTVMTPAQARVDSVSRTMDAAWFIPEAIEFIRDLEAAIAPAGAHVGLIGGVLVKGSSGKDLDIVVYPHGKGKEGQPSTEDLWAFLIQRYNPEELNKCDSVTQMRDDKDVRWMLINGKRVDFFFLS